MLIPIGEILTFFNTRMTKPLPYGGFHLFFFLLSVAAGVFLCKYRKNPEETFVRKLLLGTFLTVTVLEIYKQITYSFTVSDGQILFDYQWYAFPFQFCSTPMYVGVLAALVKKRTVHESLCAFLGTYSLFAGLAVMCYPVSVFTNVAGINIQTMICHGAMVSIGMYLLGSGYVKAGGASLKNAFCVFLTLLLVAAVLNEIAFRAGILASETFNMFFISPYCPPELPVYSLIQKQLPFPLSLMVYAAAFTMAGGLILAVAALKTGQHRTASPAGVYKLIR